jgi:hypothetical protein
MAEPYQSQLAPNATPLPFMPAEGLAAPVAAGVERAGDAVDRTIHALKEQDRDNQTAAAGVQLAQVSAAMDKYSIDAREQAAPGGAGHYQAVTAEFDRQADAALGSIRDKKLRQAFTQRYAELKEHIGGREYGWEAGQRVDKLTSDFSDMVDTLGSGQAASPDAIGLDVSLKTVETTARHLAVGADVQDGLIKDGQRKIVLGWANAMQDKDPHTLVAALDKGLFNQYLQPNDVATLRSGGLVEIRRLAAEDRAQKSREEAQARETVNTFMGKLPDGYVPGDAETSQIEGLISKYKLDDKAWDLGVWKEKTLINRETRTWQPEQWHSEINALEAKGDKRSQAENVRLKLLEAAAPAAISRFNADPFAAAAAAGSPAPELNPADPASIERRVTWARAYAKSAGLVNVPYLNNDEVKDLRDRAGQGTAGRLQVASEIRGLVGAGSAGSAIARQVDPNKSLQLMVGLAPVFAQQYAVGSEAVKGGTVKFGLEPEDAEAIDQVWQQFQAAVPAEMQPAVKDAARSIAAGMAAQQGKPSLTGDELAEYFRIGLQRAGGLAGTYYGAGNSPGGFASWNGRMTWLPPAMTRSEFQRRLSRAGEAEWSHAAGGAPFYMGGDGKLVKMSKAQIGHLRDYQLETVNPGLYRLVGPDGGHVVDAHGQPWQFDIRQLGH